MSHRMQLATKAAQAPSFTPAATGLVQRKCACGGAAGLDGGCAACHHERLVGDKPPLVQTKLKVSEPGDRYEQEADRIADQVMRMPAPAVQRQPMAEEEEEDETLQMKPLAAQITPLVQRQTMPEEEDEEEDIALQRQSLTEEDEDEEEMLQAKGTAALTPSVAALASTWRESRWRKVSKRGGSVGLQGAPATPSPWVASDTVAPAATEEPDTQHAARFRRLRTGCLEDGSVAVTTSIDQNNSDKTKGLLIIKYKGEGRTKYTQDQPREERLFTRGRIKRAERGKFCFCDCMHYRQYLQGMGWIGPVGGVANHAIPEIESGKKTLLLDGQWHTEDVSTGLGENQYQTGCQREFKDTPGAGPPRPPPGQKERRGVMKAGVPIMLRYNLYLQIWDACQQRELWHDERALTIGGSTPPRTILWSSRHLSLSRASISADIPREQEDKEPLQHQPITEEEEDGEEMLQAKGTAAPAPALTPSMEAGIQGMRQGSGQPLDPATRAFMEPRFGHDFSQVRVHSGPQADAAAGAVNARAFTVGRDVVFGMGQYAPKTAAGQRLLAHELTHVVQQSGSSNPGAVQRAPLDGPTHAVYRIIGLVIQGSREQVSLDELSALELDEIEALLSNMRDALRVAQTHKDRENVHLFLAEQLLPVINQLIRAAEDPLCSTFDFSATRRLASAQGTEYQATKGAEQRLALIRTLKLIWRCSTLGQQKQVQADLTALLHEQDAATVWQEAGTPFGGYTGMYPGYAFDIGLGMKRLGVSETAAFRTFELEEEGKALEEAVYKSRAKRVASRAASDLGRTDIIYFRGDQYAQYRAPGVFTNFRQPTGFDLRYIEKTGGFPNVKLMISTTCATLCKEAIQVFHNLFPNAVILGLRKSDPGKAGIEVRNAFESKIKALSRPLLLDQPVDINAIISEWKSVIEEKFGGSNRLPGYYDGKEVHYWDGAEWKSIGAMDKDNKCAPLGTAGYPAPR